MLKGRNAGTAPSQQRTKWTLLESAIAPGGVWPDTSNWRTKMTIGIGRRRLVVNFVVDRVGSIADRFPAAELASDTELARLEARRNAQFDRTRWESNAALYGVGHPR